MAHKNSPTGTGLPTHLPLFPLRGALLLPGAELPLNIFEPRYLAMTEWALRTDRMIGMIQPRAAAPKMSPCQLYSVGCAGRITHYQEMDDGRYLITLRGISRFTLHTPPQLTDDHFLLGLPDWTPYTADQDPCDALPAHLCRSSLKELLTRFLAREELSVDWDQVASISEDRFFTLLAMIAPLDSAEKQSLLEAASVLERCEMLVQMLEIAMATQTPHHDRTTCLN